MSSLQVDGASSLTNDRLPYADVAVDAYGPSGEPLTYAVPASLTIRPGHLVHVPFGRRVVRGVVTGLARELRAPYARDVLGFVHPEPLLTETQLDLARWVSERWRAPLFDAIALMLPPGFRTRTHSVVRLLPGAVAQTGGRLAEPDDLPRHAGAKRLLAYLRQHPHGARPSALARRLGAWAQRAARALVDAGLAEERIEEPSMRREQRTMQRARVVYAAALEELAVRGAARAPRRAALARSLLAEPGATALASDLRARFGAGALRRLVDLGLVELLDAPADAPRPRAASSRPEHALLPTPSQAAALQAIRAALDDASVEPRAFLLHGVTGSGKTEVYLQALARCLDWGKSALVLVPELSLTPQTLARFEARFPGQVVELHSGLAVARQWESWWRVHRGEGRIVVGSRSAIFAPQGNLGLIVLDEEHEWTYKQQDPAPRYHARDVATELSRKTGAVLVLGSATPDVATMYEAQHGRYGLVTLPRRIERSGADARLADVEVVDMRDELRSGNRSVFSRSLRGALESCLERGRQAILFLNRRGAASIVECRSCGNVVRCPRCATPYTFHADAATSHRHPGESRGQLVCHHCNHRRGVPSTCADCGSAAIRYLGVGTQTIVEEVSRLAPSARVLRWDRDAASTSRAHQQMLDAFASHRADVLVGTQMIAKGLDVPSVTLVGMVLADVGLHVPDFRGGERTFQVLTQVAGRAGRDAEPGRAIIQTYNPEHYAIRAAAAQDYDAFYREELAYRRAQLNPPFNRLVRLVFGDANPTAAEAAAHRLAGALRRAIDDWGVTRTAVVGPAPTHPPKVRNAWRWQLLLRGPDPAVVLDRVKLPAGWTVDVDPTSTI